MKEEFLKFVQKHDLFKKDGNILVAVSGGIDSVVLCDLLYETGVRFAVAHANFMLRGDESEADMQFVEALALRYGVRFYMRRFETKSFAEEHDYSIQEAASKLRYAWFEELVVSERFDAVATAHQADDHAETILWNLIRGTGIDGLRGIAVKHGRVIRPMLFVSRAQIVHYAEERGIIWREDSSNVSDRYRRNFIRRHVLPLLRELNPNLNQTLSESAERVAAAGNVFKQSVLHLKEQAVLMKKNSVHIDINTLKKFYEPLIGLYELLKPYGFNYRTVKDIFSALEAESGKKFTSNTYELIKDRRQLIITPLKEEDEVKVLFIAEESGKAELPDAELHYEIVDRKDISGNLFTDSETALLDREKLRFPLVLRRAKKGDRFVPLGMRGSKKISDLLVDLKVPVHQKKWVYVLTSGEDIVWVVGYRSNERFKVDEKTTSIFRLRIIPASG